MTTGGQCVVEAAEGRMVESQWRSRGLGDCIGVSTNSYLLKECLVITDHRTAWGRGIGENDLACDELACLFTEAKQGRLGVWARQGANQPISMRYL